MHKESVVACALTPGPGKDPPRDRQQFGTTTGEWRRLAAWLTAHGVTHAARESTGVYWKPVFNVRESSCALILVNARHRRNVPGRKTDKADAAWIANLLRHGLLEASFVPEGAVRERRDLCRMRTTLVRECVQVGNRLRKVLADANSKLDSVAADTLGVSGRSMIEALMAGETDPVILAGLARGRLKSKHEALVAALEGRVTPHHRFLLTAGMRTLPFLEQEVERVVAEIVRHMPPFKQAATLLQTMPGVDRTTACALLGEIGADMSRFPTARHLASGAGVCPGNNASAGKQRSGKSHRGNRWVKGVLTEMAGAATRTKNTSVQALYRRLLPHRGAKRALVAVAHSLLQAAWHMLRAGEAYQDLGADYFLRQDQERMKRQLIKRLEKLGYAVELKHATAG